MGMTIKFQKKVLRFLARPENKRYISLVDMECFDTTQLKLGYELLRAYIEEFNSVPDLDSMIEYFHQSAAVKKMKPEDQVELAASVEALFVARNEDTGLVVKSITDYAARKQAVELLKRQITVISEGGLEEVKKLHSEVGKIASIDSRLMNLETRRGGFLLKDHLRSVNEIKPGAPTFLKRLNNMTAAGGFMSPQLVILLSAPKGFKTGLALNLAVEYLRDGKNVYYADWENGVVSIKVRAQQKLMEMGRNLLGRPENIRSLQKVMKKMKTMGGDMIVDNYAANVDTVAVVEAQLAEYWEQYAWKPDLIIWDYPDLIKPIHPKRERRHEISAVYFDIINLNNRLGCFSIGVSQVNKAAVGKPVLTMTDFGEDFGKAMNCHASFALCRTEEEVEAGIGRIVPVVQREGKRYKASVVCFVKIDEEAMKVEEISVSQAKELMALVMPVGRNGQARKLNVKQKDLKDE